MVSSEWGRSPWRIDVGRLTDAPPARAPVVVIGGGLTGLGAAYALTRRDIPVALLEAATIGAGASGRIGAIALEHTAAGPLEGMNDCLPHLAAIVERERIACARSPRVLGDVASEAIVRRTHRGDDCRRARSTAVGSLHPLRAPSALTPPRGDDYRRRLLPSATQRMPSTVCFSAFTRCSSSRRCCIVSTKRVTSAADASISLCATLSIAPRSWP